MSRSKKKSKPPGYEFWSRRPGKTYSPGRYAKKVTHKIERLRNILLAKKEKETI